MFCVKYCTV